MMSDSLKSTDKLHSMFKMPHVEKNMTVGLFGGSFNPPHNGHLLVAQTALRRLNLDQIWWMVTPGNPLKSTGNLASLTNRIQASRILTNHPKIKVTAFEATHDLHYTAKTLRFVSAHNPGVNFIWIMGADNLADFHNWTDWKQIMTNFPIAIIDRPGSTLSFLSSPAAQTFNFARIDEDDSQILAHKNSPAWCFLHGPRSSLSSTKIRNDNRLTL